VVLAARRGVIVLHEAFGRLRPDPDQTPLPVDSIFPVESVSKPITATAAMLLVEDGVLGLNRPIRDYLPEISGAGAEDVLVHHLLTHTSGYNDEEIFSVLAQRMREGFDPGPCEATQHPALHRLLAVCYPHPVSKPPGAEMIYSDVNFELVAEIVRRLTSRSLDDFARERIFEPLGMNDSSYVVPESARPRIVKRPPHAPFAQGTVAFPGIDSREHEELPSGSSGVSSTAKDVAAFAQMFCNAGTYGRAQILSRAAVAAMTRNQIPGIGITFNESRYNACYGWFVETAARWRYWNGSLSSNGSFAHAGAGGVQFWADPENEIVGVYLSVQMQQTKSMDPVWNFDLFQNAVTAAVAD
jgi:CubicO group peptidase (beta-lactamase class C family)